MTVTALGVAALGVAALALAGCGTGAGATSQASPSPIPPSSAISTKTSVAAPTGHAHHPPPARRHRRRHVPARISSVGLAYSSAANGVVQGQPPPGSCHAIGSGLYSRPDPACTPGALNPAVTQATIEQTICVDGWTETVRPAESITEQEKAASTAAYGDRGSLGDYEYDHFVPLELGGATNDPRNLWPEPGASPNPKDEVEDQLRSEVCDGQISLGRAQHEIVGNWVALAASPAGSAPASGSSSQQPSASGGPPTCTITASYSSHYQDYDVYVRSNQPDQTVTVTDPAGHADSWHTDATGSADVYFRAGGQSPGDPITVRVGGATCSATL